MDSFYIILPSNTGDLEQNTTSNFTVRLPDTLELDSNWTVALSNIIYPFSFSMLDEEEGENSSITIYRRYGNELRSILVGIPDIFYKDEEALMHAINSILLDVWEKELHKKGGDYERDAASGKSKRQLPPEGQLKTPERIEESEETKKAVAKAQQIGGTQTVTPIHSGQETEGQLERIEESEEIKRKVQELIDAKQKEHSTSTQTTVNSSTSISQQPATSQTPSQPVTSIPSGPRTEGELKIVERIEESDEVKKKVQEFIDERQRQQQIPSNQPSSDGTSTGTISQPTTSQTPMDGTLTPIPKDTPAPLPKGFEPELHEPLLKLAKSASDRAWKKSVEAAKKAQQAQELADHYFTLARLKFARKDYVETTSGTGELIQVRKTPEHIFEWVREQIEVIKQRKDLVASKAQIAADAASRAANAKRETDAAVERKDVAEARKAADRAKNGRRTAEDGNKQAQEALDELKKLSEEVVKKVDTALYEQDNPSEPVILPMPPPSPPPLVQNIPTTLDEGKVDESESKDEPSKLEEEKDRSESLDQQKTKDEGDEEETDADFEITTSDSKIKQKPDILFEWPEFDDPNIDYTEEQTNEKNDMRKPSSKKVPKTGIFISPSYEIPSPVDEAVEPWTPTEQLPALPEAQALQAGFFASTMGREPQRRIHFAEHAYPSEYTRMLMKMTKEQLADPHYQWVYFHYDTMHHRFWVSMQGNVQYIVLSKQLAYTMGFDTQRLYHGHVAKYMPDIAGGARQLVVYAPKLVENSIIGNVTAPILRVVNVTGNQGQCISSIYETEHHHRLLGKRHPEITIEIRTLAGKLVKFHWGNCILTLHFQ